MSGCTGAWAPGKLGRLQYLGGMAELGGVGEGSGRGQKAATCEAPRDPTRQGGVSLGRPCWCLSDGFQTIQESRP